MEDEAESVFQLVEVQSRRQGKHDINVTGINSYLNRGQEDGLQEVVIDDSEGTAGTASVNRQPVESLGTPTLHQGSNAKWHASYIQAYFAITNYMGVVPYRYSLQNQKKTWLKVIPYGIIQALLSIQILIQMRKLLWLGASITGNTEISAYIMFGRRLVGILCRITFSITTYYHSEKFLKFMDIIDWSKFADSLHTSKRKWTTWGILLFSLHLTLFKTIALPRSKPGPYFNWLCTFYKREVTSVFIASDWDDYIHIVYDGIDELETSTVVLGFLGCILHFIYVGILQLSRDLLLISILMLKAAMSRFSFKTSLPGIFGINAVVAPMHYKVIGGHVVPRYRELMKISRAMNNAIGPVYQILFLADNLLMLATFYNYCLRPDIPVSFKLGITFEVIHVAISFYLAERVAAKVTEFRDWLRDTTNSTTDSVDRQEVHLIIDEIGTNLIGLGRESLFMNKGFLINLFAINIAYFFSVVETRNTSKSP